MPQNVSTTTIYVWKIHSMGSSQQFALPQQFAHCQCSPTQGNSSFAWSLFLLLFNKFLKMLFNAPECISHYYLCVENTQHGQWPAVRLLPAVCSSPMQPNPRKQRICLVIISVTLQLVPKDAIWYPRMHLPLLSMSGKIQKWQQPAVRPSPADRPSPCSSSQGISSFSWSLFLILFNQYLKMLFDTPAYIYHYYLLVENTQQWQ